jgi:hypothetical protein
MDVLAASWPAFLLPQVIRTVTNTLLAGTLVAFFHDALLSARFE